MLDCLSEIEVLAHRFSDYKVVSYFCRSDPTHGGVLILARNNLRCVDDHWAIGVSVEFVCEMAST